jgi:outer membrane protein OmpA-like peptidoglycan-associated protein
MGCCGLLLLAVPGPARATEWSLKLEPGFAAALSSPQTDLFNLGGALTAKGLIGLGRYVDVGPTVGFVGLGNSNANAKADAGTGWEFGAGARVKRPHDTGLGVGAASPWLDLDLMYVRTGPLNRFAYAVGAGAAWPVDRERRFRLGPFVRYLQIVQGDRVGFDNHDAKILIVGLSLEVGNPQRPALEAQPASGPAPCAAPVECPPIARLPDRDGDGVPDKFDRCPDVPGPIDNQGCPRYEKIIVREDKIELKEHIQFAWNESTIEPASHPLLNEVVRALNENRSWNVRIQGHASSEGAADHNQKLSEGRAQAVLQYLASHGVAKERLSYKGFSSSMPLEPNTTAQGREANRRVVFKVDLIILNQGSAQ